jgi:cation diffusion facilitator CzcD-associated flavoprotein CzcO
MASERVAIVGGGLCGFVAYLTLRRAGVEDVTVFATDADPAATFRVRAAAIRQTHMRSESDGHVAPATFPGLAVRDALARRSPKPLVASVLDRYHATVETFLAHVEARRAASGWSPVPARIARVTPVDGGFALDARLEGRKTGCLRQPWHGVFEHVLIATGHPGLNIPEELRDDPRVVHAYEPHDYAESVCVVGAGLAAATEWRNALAAGARVTSVRRREPVQRPLNVPRPFLTKRGLARFHALRVEQREQVLHELLAPSYPREAHVDVPVERRVNGADQVICATGFRRGWEHDPVLAGLVREHDVATVNGWLALDRDATVPSLTDDTRTLALAGVAAQWAYPAADTLMGARFVAHGFARRCRTR